jgi:KipI family sensor histidine kinase inhibitor
MTPDDYRLRAAGDSSLVIELDARIDAEVNARVIALGRSIRAAAPDGVREVVTAYHTATIYFDPLRTEVDALGRTIEGCAARLDDRAAGAADRQPILVPVCYGGEFGPDLADVARFAGCTEEEASVIHRLPVYRVYMLGFLPGFTYMGSVDPRIAAARRETPRLRVAAGSIGIAGRQTGIYPAESPGGWRLIGRTPLRPFDPARRPPFLFEPGDLVEFVAISAERYAELASPHAIP